MALAARAIDYMRSRIASDITLRDVAQHCGLSRAYFAMAFRISTGVTPHQWLLEHRVEVAHAMMRDATLRIREIAIACGFADQSHLTRVFTRIVGASPGQWRRWRLS